MKKGLKNLYTGQVDVDSVFPICIVIKKTSLGIISAMSQFWWGDDDQQKHIHWFACGKCASQKIKVA
jgi:hypothetical protein